MARSDSRSRALIAALVLLAASAVALAVGGWRHHQATVRFASVVRDTEQAADLAEEVRRLQVTGRKAVEPSAESLKPAAFFQRLSAALGIAPESVKGIETRSVPQAKESPYEELATVVRLSKVPQDKVGAFLERIEAENPQYLVKDVRLVAGEGTGAVWDATITVSLLVYKPESIGTESP
jgi:hypothetical protein